MRVNFLYTFPIMITLSTSALLSSGGIGFLLTILLFLLCFSGVHLLLWAKFGIENNHPKKEIPQEKTQEKAPAKEQEPIYYVIERKRKKPKTTYSEPRQITFKED